MIGELHYQPAKYIIVLLEAEKHKSNFPSYYQTEVTAIRKSAPVNVILYYPKTETGKEELARRVSDVHAAVVARQIKALHCPTAQKLQLLDAVIETARERSTSQRKSSHQVPGKER